MPARDMYHAAVRHALIADGWTITNDPLVLKFGERDMYVDLGAEQQPATSSDCFRSTA